MTETKHTPGPWSSGPTGSVMMGYSQPFAVAEHGSKNLIAGCFGDVRGGPDTAEANARLIVRAVNSHDDMLTALRPFALLAKLHGDDHEQVTPALGITLGDCRRAAKAIAKAEGGS